MRARLASVILAAAAACGDADPEQATAADAAASGGPDANLGPFADASPGEDLDMKLADFGNIQGLTKPAGRNYFVANPLGHLPEALAAASSPTGGTFPVGSIVLAQKAEVMVKRRVGWNPVSRDWEFFRIRYDGTTPAAIEVRGATETSCFSCHASVSSAMWDLVCDHP